MKLTDKERRLIEDAIAWEEDGPATHVAIDLRLRESIRAVIVERATPPKGTLVLRETPNGPLLDKLYEVKTPTFGPAASG